MFWFAVWRVQIDLRNEVRNKFAIECKQFKQKFLKGVLPRDTCIFQDFSGSTCNFHTVD